MTLNAIAIDQRGALSSLIKNKSIAAEFLGTFLLVQAIVGSGVMAKNLSDDILLQLLINAIAAVTTLTLIISIFKGISGAHFNPIVSILSLLDRKSSPAKIFVLILAQLLGAFCGAIIANLSFGLDAISISSTERTQTHLLVGEVIATFGLIFVVLMRPAKPELAIPLWIAGAYFFTSSTSFANPAVTFGRIFSDTFAGISPSSAFPFLCAQCIGAALALLAVRIFFNERN